MDANDALTPSRDQRILEMARQHLAGVGRRAHERSLIFAWTEAFGGALAPPLGGVYHRFDEQLGWTYVVPADALTPRQRRLIRELAGFSAKSWGPGPAGGRQRTRPLRSDNVIRGLAIHYLSKAGGGPLTVADAYTRLCEAVPEAYSDRWDEPDHYAIIREIERRYGSLISDAAA